MQKGQQNPWKQAASRQPNDQSGGAGRKALWLGLFVVVAVVGGRWFWRQMQFSRLRMPLIKAVKAGDAAQVRDLLEQGADPDVRLDYKSGSLTWMSVLRMLTSRKASSSSQVETVLMTAADQGKADIVRLLLEHGADVNIKLRPNDRRTALEWAAGSGAVECIKLLIAHGAALEARDNEGRTALTQAVWYGEPASVRTLVEGGADINSQDQRGESVLMHAVERAEYEKQRRPLMVSKTVSLPISGERTTWLTILQWLLEKGADPYRKDLEGQSALDLAQRLQDQEVLALLRKAAARASGAGKGARR